MVYFSYEMSGHLIVSGEDAADFLQSQFSADLGHLRPGQAVYGLWLDVRGRIVADSWVFCQAQERFHLFSEHGSASTIAAKLERHIVADEVIIAIQSEAPAVALIDERAEARANEAGAFACLPGRRGRTPSAECIFQSVAGRDAFVNSLGSEAISEAQLHAFRLEAGVPLVPQEAGPGELPGEVGLDHDAVDFQKGCFLGQEVVARMRNVGKPTRGLYLVRSGDSPPSCPADITSREGKTIGELRSVHVEENGWRGVALLKIRALEAASGIFVNGQELVVINEYTQAAEI